VLLFFFFFVQSKTQEQQKSLHKFSLRAELDTHLDHSGAFLSCFPYYCLTFAAKQPPARC
jgi:hypothetical protein